ncbi:MerR family transcriptional regulator [Gordonia jinhuaensis]|uniref:MerR family transcriptional regulator n=1 Tax=Gordonia jinhuaensis TaxID=1517702 RepID=UPI0016685D53|nr:MerR family transcriptional regulator [Gordonia jinhuaensis]
MAEYRINELSDVSGVSVRNIRVYQDRGLLPPPRIKGRTGWYSDEHLVRLNLIARMLDRGYNFATISELLLAAHHGLKVESVLHDAPKPSRWRNFKRAATITVTELRRTLNASDTSIALGQRLGLLVREGKDYAIANPEVLEGAEALVKGGIPLELLLERWERVQGDLEDVARSFVSLITDQYFGEDGRLLATSDAEVSKIAGLIQSVRPMAHDIVLTTFRKALDDAISTALAEASEIWGGQDGEAAGGSTAEAALNASPDSLNASPDSDADPDSDASPDSSAGADSDAGPEVGESDTSGHDSDAAARAATGGGR